jgi:hypothetical protein
VAIAIRYVRVHAAVYVIRIFFNFHVVVGSIIDYKYRRCWEIRQQLVVNPCNKILEVHIVMVVARFRPLKNNFLIHVINTRFLIGT